MKRLIVLVPGITYWMKHWRPLKQRLLKEADLADCTWREYYRPWSPFTPPKNFAIDLRAFIDNVWRIEGPFDEVLLVGHSFGGLLVRQAFLLGSGVVLEDYAHKDEWCHRVKRFILFASVNRGFNPQNLHVLRFLYVMVFRFFPLYKQLEAGSDFITDLRIRWIRHFRKLGTDAPKVVQLLGTKDGIVTRSDSIDVSQFPSAEEIEIPGANHINLHRFKQESHYRLIRDAFLKTFEAKRQPAKKPVSDVVFILHGIRANNSEWVEQARACIEKSHPNAEIVAASYGYLPALDFIFPLLRRRNINWFKDTYSYYYALYPDADFRFLGHSNGTYLLGRSLLRVYGIVFKRVVLVGSVLPRGYEWKEVFDREQVKLLRNDRANRDIPVAILCSALRGLGMRDVGTAGFDGFDFKDERTRDVFYYDGGHSKALDEKNIDHLIRFLMTDHIDKTPQHPELRKNTPSKLFKYLSRAAPFICAILLLLIFYVLYDYRSSLTSAMLAPSRTAWIVAAIGVVVIGLIRAI